MITIRKSNNIGGTWDDIVVDQPFYPESSVKGAILPPISSPYTFLDKATNTILLFFIVEEALMCEKIPVEVFQDSKTKAESIIKKIKPKMIYGNYSSDMADRGVAPASSLDELEEEELKVPSQRVTAMIDISGFARVFFKNGQGALISLISSNLGEVWHTEKEYAQAGVQNV